MSILRIVIASLVFYWCCSWKMILWKCQESRCLQLSLSLPQVSWYLLMENGAPVLPNAVSFGSLPADACHSPLLSSRFNSLTWAPLVWFWEYIQISCNRVSRVIFGSWNIPYLQPSAHNGDLFQYWFAARDIQAANLENVLFEIAGGCIPIVSAISCRVWQHSPRDLDQAAWNQLARYWIFHIWKRKHKWHLSMIDFYL